MNWVPTEEDRVKLRGICSEPGCINKPSPGYVLCIRHLHGADEHASDELIDLKNKLDEYNLRNELMRKEKA